jgi:hypothetical protein
MEEGEAQELKGEIARLESKLDSVLLSLRTDRGVFDEPVRAPSFIGFGDLITHGVVRFVGSGTPTDPATTGEGVIYVQASTGDLLWKINFGGTVKSGSLVDWSAA